LTMMLRRCAHAQIVTIAALALWAAVLAFSPATASAKATPLTEDPQESDSAAGGAKRIVVAPGDAVWAISAQWLGPEATAQQIADGAKRIYALNEERIGNDPNLLLAGQSLLLPSEVERRSAELGSAASARHAGTLTAPSPPARAANDGSDPAATTGLGEADRRARQARSDAQTQPPSLPDPTQAIPVAAVGLLAPHDSPPSLVRSVVSDARSAFSAVVAAAAAAFPHGSYSGRQLLGGALMAMSSVIALILAVHVAREAWGPSYARSRARERWVREVRRVNRASPGPFDGGFTYPAASAFKVHPPANGPLENANWAPIVEGPRAGGPAGRLANGNPSSDNVRKVGRSRLARIRKTRALEAKRPARGHRAGAVGIPRLGRAGQRPLISLTPAQRTRALRRKGGRTVGTESREPHPTQEWKIREPLMSAMGAIPVHPGARLRDCLLEVKPLVADELTTVASLEQHRGLSEKEQRQARALQRFLATIEEVSNEAGLR
jgi:hypothetical protein